MNLTLVDKRGVLTGLITSKDLVRQRRLPFATRDAQGRLMVGAAIGATGDYLERAAELIRAGVDVLVIDIAHGHSIVMDRAIKGRPKASDSCLTAVLTASRQGSGPAAAAQRE
jgi:IMP dehydrogenase